MEIYRFKCKCCGATRYKKPTKNIYRCLYCGEEVEVYRKSETEQSAQPEVQVQPVQPTIATAEPKPKQNRPEPQLETRNIIALVLCLAGGWFGLHKFMRGQIIWGLIYAFTGGVMGIGVFIDAMMLAIDSAKDIKKYNREKADFEK